MTKEELIAKIIERQGIDTVVVQDSHNEWVVKYVNGNESSYCYEEEFILGSRTRYWLNQLNKLYP